MATLYIERDCVVRHEGRTFEAGGAVITESLCIAYVGPQIEGRGFNGRLGTEPPIYSLIDWHGQKIGTIRLAASWPIRGGLCSARMFQAYTTFAGITYTGRTCGEGMIFKGHRVMGRP